MFGKFFFSSELIEPYAELTIEESIKKLNNDVTTLSSRVDSIGGKVSTLESTLNQHIVDYTNFSNEIYSQLDMIKTKITDIEIKLGDINSILDNINGEVI